MSEQHQHDHEHGEQDIWDTLPNTAEGWDQRYSGEQVWSGNPNLALVAEAGDLPGGRALDIGCGEGADSVWLATRGWTVTSLDISSRAVEHTRRAAEAAGVAVSGLAQPFEQAELEGPFELVSAMYPVLERRDEVIAKLLALVAPGGTLLFVHHADVDKEHARMQGFDPDALVDPQAVATALRARDDWRIDVDERRERRVGTGRGSGHHADLVVRATRLS